MNLRKFFTNSNKLKVLLSEKDSINQDKEVNLEIGEMDQSESVKTLGLYWNTGNDQVNFRIISDWKTILTKRMLFS
jgi:hypothetical protein